MPLLSLSSKSLTVPEFTTVFRDFLRLYPNPINDMAKVAVAVSGGPDSLALLSLLSKTVGPSRVAAITIDHDLFDHFNIVEDIPKIKELVVSLGVIEHHVAKINWGNERPLNKNKLQQAARDRRYQLLSDICIREKIPLLLTGHNLDDDIVTAIYRTSRLSGIDGMAGMKPINILPTSKPLDGNVILGRPLLSVPKARLLNTCKEMSIEYCNDLSNADYDYSRNEISRILAEIQENNPKLAVENFSSFLSILKNHRSQMVAEVKKAMNTSVILEEKHGQAVLLLNSNEWATNKNITSRVITHFTQYASCDPYPPRLQTILDVQENLAATFSYIVNRDRRLVHVLRKRFNVSELPINQKTRRTELKTQTLGGSVFYPLSQYDVTYRLRAEKAVNHRVLEPSPAVLIQVSPPTKKAISSRHVIVTLAPGESYIWDGRFQIRLKAYHESQETEPRTFKIFYFGSDRFKSLEASLRRQRAQNQKLWNFALSTPGNHLYTIPYIEEDGSDYVCLPTLGIQYPKPIFEWETAYLGTQYLKNKLQA